jgi:mannose-1-phosphate guanylyltransferase
VTGRRTRLGKMNGGVMATDEKHPGADRNSQRCDQPSSPQCTVIPPGRAPWAVLLAGGEGERLRTLTTKISGDSRPKQFCCLLENKSLLLQTHERVARVFREDHTIFVVTQAHERWYHQDIQYAPTRNIIAQPLNRGTGVAMATAVLHILARDPNAMVAFFPCDHFYSDNAAFTETVKFGLTVAAEHPDCIAFLGAHASSPEAEYGWIEPGPSIPNVLNRRLMRVVRFWEKPTALRASELLQQGCLWNTFVSVGLADTFLELLCSQVPNVVFSLSQNPMAYETVRSVDFSRDVMANEPHRLLVIEDDTSGWADLGNPSRLIEILRSNHLEPAWMQKLIETNKLGSQPVEVEAADS